jgi:hypothetical protein
MPGIRERVYSALIYLAFFREVRFAKMPVWMRRSCGSIKLIRGVALTMWLMNGALLGLPSVSAIARYIPKGYT